MTVQDLIKRYMRSNVSNAPLTLKKKRIAADEFIGAFGNVKVDDLTIDRINQWIRRKQKSVSNAYLNSLLAILRHVLRFGIENAMIENAPGLKVKKLPEERKLRKGYTACEFKRLQSHAAGLEKEYLICLWHSMARVSEINRLRWEQVDFEQRRVLLGNGGSRTKLAGYIPMNKELERSLKRVAPQNGGPRYVFNFKDKRKWFRALHEKAGVEYRGFHGLRRGSATVVLQKGANIAAISKCLRHQRISTTQVYLGVSDQELEETMNLLL